MTPPARAQDGASQPLEPTGADPSETLPVLSHADQERLTWLGGEALLRAMIDLFLEHAPRRAESASRGLSAGDFGAIRRAAHSLRSTAANLGALRLTRTAGELEAAAQSGDRAYCERLLDALGAELEAATSELRTLRETSR